jgi:signal transduction histidine kinase
MKGTLRVLSLEDMEEDYVLIERTLRKSGLNFISLRVDTREELLHALKDFNPEVILSDHSLPQLNSIEALSLVREQGFQAPFILVTGAVSEEFAVRSLKQGADDYVLKSNLARLPNVIYNALKQKESEQAKVKAAEELAQQNDELMKINKELDSFVYSVSHNLRAPLMSVLGLLNLAKHETNENDVKQYHEMMEISIHKLDDTLKEILDYSRNARQGIIIEPINFKKLINDNFDRMQFMPGFESIRKNITIDESSPFYSDNYRLSVIMNNLISNAIKYYDGNKENPFIEITVKINEDRCVIKFQDNGIGIDPKYITRVFDMFFRATGKNEGAGLGLYIVKEATEKLKGHVEIESKLGQGTTFKIELPNFVNKTSQEANKQLEPVHHD